MPDEISLSIGSSRLLGWKNVSVNRSMDTLSSSFSFNMVDIWEENPIDLIPNLSCKIYLDTILILTGFIDSVDIKVDPSNHELSIKGRDKTCDLIDCSADNSPGSWKNINLQKLIYELTKSFKINVIRETDFGEDIKDFTLNTGEAPFEAIQRICNDRGILPLTNMNGDLILTSSGSRKSFDKLIYGENITDADISYDFANRFSIYKVKGQKSGDGNSWKNSTSQIYGESRDEGIDRYRPKIITADEQMTNSLASRKASWEAQTRAGRSGKLSVSIPTWKQSNGEIWDINMLVSCDIPPFKIFPDDPLLLYEIEYKQDNEGTSSILKFIRKDSYLAEPPKVIKTKSKSKSIGFGW